jgi:hypothetical protein
MSTKCDARYISASKRQNRNDGDVFRWSGKGIQVLESLLRQTEFVTFSVPGYWTVDFPLDMYDELFALVVEMPALQKLEFKTWKPRIEELLCRTAIPHLSVRLDCLESLTKVLESNSRIRLSE